MSAFDNRISFKRSRSLLSRDALGPDVLDRRPADATEEDDSERPGACGGGGGLGVGEMTFAVGWTAWLLHDTGLVVHVAGPLLLPCVAGGFATTVAPAPGELAARLGGAVLVARPRGVGVLVCLCTADGGPAACPRLPLSLLRPPAGGLCRCGSRATFSGSGSPDIV